MKLNYFVDEQPLDYEKLNDSHRHLRYHDYKHLKDVTWVDDSESLTSKVLTGLAFVVTLIILVFIATI